MMEVLRVVGMLFLIGASVVIILRGTMFSIIKVNGHSMENTIQHTERVFVNRRHYTFNKPERFDIVLCRFQGIKGKFIKRVIALPGEAIKIDSSGCVYINDQLLQCDAVQWVPGIIYKTVDLEVPKDGYFVMGDNRLHSRDSRSLGTVGEKDILGKVLAVNWPKDRARLLSARED